MVRLTAVMPMELLLSLSLLLLLEHHVEIISSRIGRLHRVAAHLLILESLYLCHSLQLLLMLVVQFCLSLRIVVLKSRLKCHLMLWRHVSHDIFVSDRVRVGDSGSFLRAIR